MMSEFENSVEGIMREMGIGNPDFNGEADSGIRVRDLGNITAEYGGGGRVNCYPGNPGGGCHSMAYFFSLKNPELARGGGHLTCKVALGKLVKHFTGSCLGITRGAVFITDNWDPVAYSEWRTTIKNLQKECLIEFYLIVGDKKIKLPI